MTISGLGSSGQAPNEPKDVPAKEKVVAAEVVRKASGNGTGAFVGVKADGRTYLSKDQEVVAQGELNKMILDWDFLNLSDMAQRELLKERLGWEVGPFSFKKLKKAVPWEEVRGKYRKAFCMFAPQIDMALIKKAVRGDTKAIELFYTRMEGWMPRTGLDVTAGGMNEVRRLDSKELVGELLKGMSEEERKVLVARGEMPGANGGPPGEVAGGPRDNSQGA